MKDKGTYFKYEKTKGIRVSNDLSKVIDWKHGEKLLLEFKDGKLFIEKL